VKTLLKSVDIYQSYCKKNLAQLFLAHPVYSTEQRSDWTGPTIFPLSLQTETTTHWVQTMFTGGERTNRNTVLCTCI